MAQKLLTKAILKKLPALYATEKQADPKVIAKFFTPWNGYTFYATEFSPEEGIFFGYIDNCGHGEKGYFSLAEIESVTGPAGLKIERDKWFTPTPLSECIQKHL